MLKLNRDHLKFIIPISFIVILLLALLIIYIKNDDITKLTKVSNKIVSTNNCLNVTIQDDNITNNKMLKLLQNNLESFNNINSDLQNIQLKKSNSEKIKQSLHDYINLNIDLYNSALDLLSNSQSEDYTNLYENLVNNEQDLLKASNNLSKSSIKLSFYKSPDTFFTYLNKHINNLYKLNREKDIYTSQKSDFLIYMNSVFSDFSRLKEDMQTALSKIREDNRDMSILINDINKKRSTFSKVKNKSYSISIPSDAQDCYAVLQDMLNSYEVYLNSLENSVKDEIALPEKSSDNKSSINIDKSYSDTFDKYSAFTSSFDALENAVSEYKNN